MGLQWIRLDTSFPTHDKILHLKAAGHWRAIVVYVNSLCYSGLHGTDGHIPQVALGIIDATPGTARQLVDARLWEYADNGGWHIVNYGTMQELAEDTRIRKAAQKAAGIRGACKRWHPPDCECWRQTNADILHLNRNTP